MHLAIDIGNSRGKLALFQDGEMLQHAIWTDDRSFSLEEHLEGMEPEGIAISSVRAELPSSLLELSERRNDVLFLDQHTLLPIEVELEDPASLGPDRAANAVGAFRSWPDRSVLIIDMGTCITFDRVDKGALIGGAISPGVGMRAEAMHRSTGKLPFVYVKERPDRIERSTHGALRAGVFYGVLEEIKGWVHAFECDHPNGVVVLTGGDASLVGKELKKGIFADPFLTLRGLDAILHEHTSYGHFPHGPSSDRGG